jgi:hypothetical protein
MEITSKRRVEEMVLAELLYCWVAISVELIVRASRGLGRVVKSRWWRRGEMEGGLEPGNVAEEIWFEAGEESAEELTEWTSREDGMGTRKEAQNGEQLRRSEVNQRWKAAIAEEIRQMCFEQNCGRERESKNEMDREVLKTGETGEDPGLRTSATIAERLRRLLRENAKLYGNDMYEAAFLNAEMEELPELMEQFLYDRRGEEVGKMRVGGGIGKVGMLGIGLVNISAGWSRVETYFTVTSPVATFSRMKWCWTPICFVRAWNTGFLANLRAL